MMNQFLEFEEENNLFKEKINDIYFWHICRADIYNGLKKSFDELDDTSITLKQNLLRGLLISIKQIPNYIFKNPLLIFKKDLLILNHSRKVKNGELYNCLYTDKFLNQENNKWSNNVIEYPYMEKHFKPVNTKNLKYTDYINFIIKIRRVVNKKKFYNEKNYSYLSSLIKKINKEFNTSLNVSKWANKIINKLEFHFFGYKYFERMINRAKPKIVIQVVSYSDTRYVINDICKFKNIPTVELQHGVPGIAYFFNKRRQISTFPDYFFSFGQFWKDTVRLPIDKSKVKVVGWPYLEDKVEYFVNSNSRYRNANKKTILFVSQWTIGEKLCKIAVDLYNKIDKDKYSIIYKLHPGEYSRWKSIYPRLINSGIQVIDTNEHDIHYFFSMSDIQIGVSSTAIFEGLNYGLETYICKLSTHEYMKTLYENNHVTLCNTADEILSCIENEDKTQKKDIDISYFWETDSINKIIKEIDEIISST